MIKGIVVLMDDICERISSIGVLPVVKIENAGDSENLAASLLAGDLPAVEITFRTDAAEESIRRIRKKFPAMLLGAGTVLTIDQIKRAVGAGADFMVAPGFNPKIAAYCTAHDIPFFPGINAPSQIEAALEYGLNVLKFFPAEVVGGVKMVKSLAAPYGHVKFIPTGGINVSNLNDYLSLSVVLACGGSWVAPAHMIRDGRFDDIVKLAHEAVSTVLGFTLSGVQLASSSESDTETILDFFASAFLLNKMETDTAVTAGGLIEIDKMMTGNGSGNRLIFSTHNLIRAMAFFKRKKIAFEIKSNPDELILLEQKGGFEVKVVEGVR